MATPGAGKTRFALRVAHDALERNAAARLVVVCPTNHLKQQWAKAAHGVGLSVDPHLTNEQGHESSDYHGCIVTYHQVGLDPAPYRVGCAARPTIVIFDEIHHAADGKDWGNALQKAFRPAVRRLALSGTPFRSDNHPIPFVTYQDGQSVPDFIYGYRDAIADRVCRPIVFPTYEGELSWVSRGREISARFSDGLGARKRQERLKTALVQEEWLCAVIRDADTELQRLRHHGDPNAGGLVVAMDQDHARRVAETVKSVSRSTVRVAVSDDPSSSQTIDRFGHSRDRWLVAVNMVSEGVDIPRLRVGVYATNVQTEMYFRQVVGRFVRMQSGLPASQRAYLYLPRDPRLVEYAESIKAERDHVLLSTDASQPRSLFEERSMDNEPFLPLSAVAVPHGRIGEDEPPAPASGQLDGHDSTARYEQKEHLRHVHKNLVSQIARQAGVDHRRIHAELIRRTGSRIESATVDQLKRRIKQLESWAARGYDLRR